MSSNLNATIVAVHPYESFVSDDFEDILKNSDSLDIDLYAIGASTRSNKSIIGKRYLNSACIYDDQNGRGVFPPELSDRVEGDDELVFMGGKLSECVPRAIRTYYQKYGDVETLAVEVNSVYEPTDESFESLVELENRNGDIPSTFSDVGGILNQYDWFS